MSDPLAAAPDRPLRIAGRGEVHEGEVTRPPVRALRAPAVSGPALLQALCGVLALVGLFVVVAVVSSPLLAVGVCALTAGLAGLVLSSLREAGRI